MTRANTIPHLAQICGAVSAADCTSRFTGAAQFRRRCERGRDALQQKARIVLSVRHHRAGPFGAVNSHRRMVVRQIDEHAAADAQCIWC